MKQGIIISLALSAGVAQAQLVDCADESTFAVIGRVGEQGLDTTARQLEKAIAAREGMSGYTVTTLTLPADDAEARQALLVYGQKIKKDHRLKRLGTLVTPAAYAMVTNVYAYYTPKGWDSVHDLALGWNKHADMLEFTPGSALTPDVMNFVCGYQIDMANLVCSFENGEPSMTAAEAVAAMEAGDWVDAEAAKTRTRIDAWAGKDEVVLVAFECDTHTYSPIRGMWPKRAALLNGGFKHTKRFARAAKAMHADVAASLGDLGYDFSGRCWKHACKGERAARMALQCAGYDLFNDGVISFIAIQGNHDTHWEALDGWGKTFNPAGAKRLDGFVLGATRGYGYYDIAAKKTRVFFVNTSEAGTGGNYAIQPEQLAFLTKAVDTTPDGWTAVIFSHDCLHRTAGDKKWKEAHWKSSKGYLGMYALLESIVSAKRIRLAGCYCGDSHFNRRHEENGVTCFICAAAMQCGNGPHSMLAHVAAIKPATGEAKLFRIGAEGKGGDL